MELAAAPWTSAVPWSERADLGGSSGECTPADLGGGGERTSPVAPPSCCCSGRLGDEARRRGHGERAHKAAAAVSRAGRTHGGADEERSGR